MNELYHHGVVGMKWGVRRYRNKDGTLTKAGKKRYLKDIRKREDGRLAKLSGKSVRNISPKDRATYSWDVEGIEDQNYPRKMSSKNKNDVKRVTKQLIDYFDYNLKQYKSTGDREAYDSLLSYKQTYVKNGEAYAKSILESIEDWSEYRNS